jgi:hypothetical protein
MAYTPELLSQYAAAFRVSPCPVMTPVRIRSHGRALEGLAMSLSAWEQQTLESIRDDLAGSDPQLAALLTTFTQLASAEEMPIQETIPAGSRRTLRWAPRPRSPWRSRHRRRAGTRDRSRPTVGHVKLQWAMLLLWLLITVVMITVALTLTHGGGQGTCTGSWSTLCSHSAAG